MDPVTAAAQFGAALCDLLGKLIDGQTAEQKARLWQDWIEFWAPLVHLSRGK